MTDAANLAARFTARLETFAESASGRIILAAIAVFVLWPQYNYVSILILAAAIVASIRTEQRPVAFSFLAILMFLAQVVPQAAGGVGFKPLVFAAAWIAAVLIASRPIAGPPVPGKDVLCRIGLFPIHLAVALMLTALAVLNISGLRPIATAFAIQQIANSLLWRTSYWVKWRAKIPNAAAAGDTPLTSRLFTLVPFFGFGGVPVGKNPEYFDRYAANTPAELAAAQLDGTKLLILAYLYRWILLLVGAPLWTAEPGTAPIWLVDLQQLIPSIGQLFHDPTDFAIYARWIGLYAELIRAILEIAIFGHTVVGICHWMGYRIPRNTRSPLWSNSILDFWTRYYFYFKELLLDFFFFPVYLKLKRFSPAVRSVIATFAAAALGNFYYHVLLYMGPLMQLPKGNLSGYLHWIGARAIYSILLATGLSFSMVRSVSNPKLQRRRWIGIIVSATFFALIHIWSAGMENITLGERWRLLGSLFGFAG